ncbi:hypothetical protein EMGBS8_15900 [Verrucomicrobiota bacterium]|nr:hypothetical protein EMGBS8_15900 [Verrucomicrobiota bacterium]
MIEFPRPGMWTIAFVTTSSPTVFSQAIGKPVVNVFVPRGAGADHGGHPPPLAGRSAGN